jgi:Holliday junction resolvase-like predicted endonuclease
MKKGLNNRLAGQIGEYLVCAELGKRGYIATSFTGNVPEFDLIVANDNLDTIPIQVKTSRGHSWPTTASLWINIDIDEMDKKQIDLGNCRLSSFSP